MRCKKCGCISFDYLDSCMKCGKSLEDEKRLLGYFVSDEESVNWFEIEITTKAAQERSQEPGPADHLSGIDVSDLVDESAVRPDEDLSVEEVELKRIAQDEDFQKALDEIAG